MARNVSKNPGRSLDITANVASAVASRNPKQAVSTLPGLIIFYNTGKGLYFGKFIYFYTIQMEQRTEQLWPSAPLMRSDQDLEQRLEKNLKDVKSFINSI